MSGDIFLVEQYFYHMEYKAVTGLTTLKMNYSWGLGSP